MLGSLASLGEELAGRGALEAEGVAQGKDPASVSWLSSSS
jgi:hypothetical protein